jgi:4-diphosphocytidyl-2-C-methyl-D-erythritol kinase
VSHLQFRCYAKINLTLEILGRRADGFHDLASLVHTISLADDLRLDSADTLRTRVEGLDLEPEANLISHAARLLASNTETQFGAQLTLAKRIPAAAGLGGGSSDAATTLVGLNRLWDARLGLADLTLLAARLGSDVPFFVRGGAALMRGRGDELQALPPLNGQWLVLVVPAHTLPDKTRQLYAALGPADFSGGEMTARTVANLQDRSGPLNQQDLVNGFARAARAVFPGFAATWAEVEDVCDRRFCLSGAGPALFALAADGADARRQQASLTSLGLRAYAARTVEHARASVKFADDPSIRYP